MTYIRIDTGFTRHIKTRRLIARLGGDGIVALLTLWTTTAENFHDGRLDDMSRDEIEMAAGWEGDKGAFVDALTDLGFLEWDDGPKIGGWESRRQLDGRGHQHEVPSDE